LASYSYLLAIEVIDRVLQGPKGGSTLHSPASRPCIYNIKSL